MRKVTFIISLCVICAAGAALVGIVSLVREGRSAARKAVHYEQVYGRGSDEELVGWTEHQLASGAACIRVYYRIHGTVPVDNRPLATVLREGKVCVRCATGDENEIHDSWGRKLSYSVSNSVVRLVSSGKDGVYGTADDMEKVVSFVGGGDGTWDLSEEIIWAESEELHPSFFKKRR